MSKFLNPSRSGTAVLVAVFVGTAASGMPPFGDFGQPANLETIPGSSPALNTPAVDGCASQAPDGLSIVFNSNRSGSQDLYIAKRGSTDQGFGTPQRLPAPVNLTDSDEFCPTLTRGGRLYFSSTRAGDIGDLYVSRQGPAGWSAPTELGGDINTGAMEESVSLYENSAGNSVLVFSRRNANGTGGQIFESVDGGPATLVGGGPNAVGSNNRPSLTHDGKTIFFDSVRPGTLGGPDLYYATRSGPDGPFGAAVHLSELSSPTFDARPFISWKGTVLTFSSARTGSESAAPDIWYTTREKDSSMEFRVAP